MINKSTTTELREKFQEAMSKTTNIYFTASGKDATRDAYVCGIYSLYYNMFGQYPYEFAICQFIEPINGYDKYTKEDYKFAKKYIHGYDAGHRIEFEKTLYSVHNKNKGNCYVTNFAGVQLIILDKYIVFWNQESSFCVLCPEYKTFEDDLKMNIEKVHPLNMLFCGDVWNEDFNINDYLEYRTVKKPKKVPKYHYVIHTQNGFDVTDLPLAEKVTINLKENYNDDLPYDSMVRFLEAKNESGIMILQSTEPGSGKSYLIRHLISNIKDRDFIVINESCLNYLTDASFVKLLLDFDNAIVILEDCERVLVDRNAGNGLIGSLLNLSDGLLSDSFNLKFICTFNAPIAKIDKAILRKGRLKVKYEFQRLTEDKTYALGKKLGKNIPEGTSLILADIYNYDEDVEFGVKKKKSVGFKL